MKRTVIGTVFLLISVLLAGVASVGHHYAE